MKKRLCIFLTLVVLAVFALVPLTACTNDKYELQTGKKYIHEEHTARKAEEQSYILFNADGTGELRSYFISSTNYYNEDYTIKFKYTYVDNDKSAVACFYDSVEYGIKHGTDKISSDWTRLYTVSKNVLCYTGSSGYTFYINEDYLNELTNFGK